MSLRGVLRLDGLVDGHRAVDVLLVPQAVHQHDRHLQRLLRQRLVHGLLAPERVVAGVIEDLPPEADLLEAALAAQLARRPGLHVHVVVVVVARQPLELVLPRRLLAVDVGQVLLAERAVVEPVVAHPAVHHRVHRHRHLERRVRVDERHERQEPVVRDPEDAHLPVGLGHVLHEPVDRVVGVGGVVDGRRVERPVQRPVHHVVALGSVLAAHVLHDADVAVLDDDVGGVVVALQDRAEVRARRVAGERRRVVGRARQQDRPVRRARRHENHRVQLHAVAHRDHHVAPVVVAHAGRDLHLRRRLARKRRVLGRRVLGLGRHGSPEPQRAGAHRREKERARKSPALVLHDCLLAPTLVKVRTLYAGFGQLAPASGLRPPAQPACHSPARAASFITVFQLRAVPRVPSLASMRALVSHDVPMPIG